LSGFELKWSGTFTVMPTLEPIRVERRCGQRFSYSVPVLLSVAGEGLRGNGFTQDLSSRGALFLTDLPLREGQKIEMSLVMPAAVTLAEDMSVLCRARVLRVEHLPEGTRSAVAVQIDKYEFSNQVAVMQQHVPVHGTRP
jgi:hypothetical protein